MVGGLLFTDPLGTLCSILMRVSARSLAAIERQPEVAPELKLELELELQPAPEAGSVLLPAVDVPVALEPDDDVEESDVVVVVMSGDDEAVDKLILDSSYLISGSNSLIFFYYNSTFFFNFQILHRFCYLHNFVVVFFFLTYKQIKTRWLFSHPFFSRLVSFICSLFFFFPNFRQKHQYSIVFAIDSLQRIYNFHRFVWSSCCSIKMRIFK